MKQYLLTEDDLDKIRFNLIQMRLTTNEAKQAYLSQEINDLIVCKEITDVDV